MKKLLLITLAAALVLGCGDDDNNPAGPSNNDPVPSADCYFYGPITQQMDHSDDLKLLGRVRNRGDATAYFVKVSASLFGSSRVLIGTDDTYVDGHNYTTRHGTQTDTAIPPNTTVSFELWTDTPAEEVITFDLIVTWQE